MRPKTSERERSRGFTLLELIIVIAILAILAVIITLALNPVELFKRTRDSQRLSDLRALKAAINLSLVENVDVGGPLNAWCVDGADPKVFFSVPTGETPPPLPPGVTANQVSTTNVRNINGSGWLPVSFTAGASSLAALPVDPVNTFADNLYYTYVCSRNPHFELTGRMESQRYQRGGSEDKISTDGGDDTFVYELGTNLTLDPMAPWGYWPMEETAVNIITGVAASYGSNTEDAAGVRGRARHKSGTFASNLITITEDRPAANPLTVGVWYKPEEFHDWNDLVVQGWVGDGWNMNISSSRRYFGVASGGVARGLPVTGLPTVDTWHHFVGVYDDPVMAFYHNGEQIGTRSDAPGHATNITADIYSLGWGDRGTIDELFLWNRALSPVEIRAIYNAR